MGDVRKAIKLLNQIKTGEKNLSDFEKSISKQGQAILNVNLEKIANELHNEIKNRAIGAIRSFYYRSSGTYNRTGSFQKLYQRSEINHIESNSLYIISFYIKAEDVTVNPWKNYPGDNEWAFDADFIHGYHGGPRKISATKYGWGDVPRENPSPYNEIYAHAFQAVKRINAKLRKR